MGTNHYNQHLGPLRAWLRSEFSTQRDLAANFCESSLTHHNFSVLRTVLVGMLIVPFVLFEDIFQSL